MFCSNKGGQEKYALTSSPKSQSSSWQNGNGSIPQENVAIFSTNFFHAFYGREVDIFSMITYVV